MVKSEAEMQAKWQKAMQLLKAWRQVPSAIVAKNSSADILLLLTRYYAFDIIVMSTKPKGDKMESYIEVYNGHGRAEEQAKAIAKHYNTTYERIDDGICQVKCNKELERAFTYDEETFEAACEEVAQCTGVAIYVDDIGF